MGVILGVGQNWPSKTKIPIFGNFSKNVTYIKKECILGVHFKFQRNRTIIAPVRAFQRKSINHFGTAAVTLNTVRNDLWWSQMKGVGPRNSFTWKFVKFCYLGSKNQGWSDLTPPVHKWGMNSPCNKGLNTDGDSDMDNPYQKIVTTGGIGEWWRQILPPSQK